MATVVGGNGGRGFGVGQGRAANERASKDEKDKSALGKARMGEVRMKGENEGEEEERRMKSKRERESVEHSCGGRQVSGCARFTLAFANGDTSRRKGESESLLSPRDEKRNEEEPRGEPRKKRGERGRGRICPEEKSHQARYTGITPLVRSARGSNEIPGPGPRTRGYTEECRTRAHPPTMGRATIYYSRAS